jgi:hypothetical protein
VVSEQVGGEGVEDIKFRRSSSSPMVKTQSAKFEIEKFNGKNNFEIWKVKMHDLLVQQGVVKVLLGKAKQPVTITDEDWDEIDARALSAIRLCLVDDVLFNIVAEKTTVGLWTKLESLYMTKSLTNRIFLKRTIVQFVHEGRYENS